MFKKKVKKVTKKVVEKVVKKGKLDDIQYNYRLGDNVSETYANVAAHQAEVEMLDKCKKELE